MSNIGEIKNLLNIKDTEECIDIISKSLKHKDNQITLLQNQVYALKLEHYKDVVMQDMQKEIDELKQLLQNSFVITNSEKQVIDRWIERHTQEKHNNNTYAGAIGGRYTYEFTPTSIGNMGVIKCSCGEEYTFSVL